MNRNSLLFINLWEEMQQGLGRRMAAFALACVMTFTSIPFTAFAESGDTIETEPEWELVIDEFSTEEETAEASELTEEAQPLSEEMEAEVPEESEVEPTQEETEEVETEQPAETETEIQEELQIPDEETLTVEQTEEQIPEEETEALEQTEEAQIAEPMDITADHSRLSLGLKNWWYTNPENLPAIADHSVDYSAAQCDEAGISAGVSLHVQAQDVNARDWFVVRLPQQMENAALDSVGAELMCWLEASDWGTDLVVSFASEGSCEADVSLHFTLKPGAEFAFDLSGHGTYQMVPPTLADQFEEETVTEPTEEETVTEPTEEETVTEPTEEETVTEPTEEETVTEPTEEEIVTEPTEEETVTEPTEEETVTEPTEEETVTEPTEEETITEPTEEETVTEPTEEETVTEPTEEETVTEPTEEETVTEPTEEETVTEPTEEETVTEPTEEEAVTEPTEEEIIAELPEEEEILDALMSTNQDPEQTFKIHIDSILYVDTRDGIAWGDVTRPQIFDSKGVMLTAYVKAEDGTLVPHNVPIQDLVATDSCYLNFAHDGRGGSDIFEILNVPYKIEVEGQSVPVTKYVLSVDTKNMPAYQCESTDEGFKGCVITPPSTENQQPENLIFNITEFKLELANMQKVTLDPEVGEGSDPANFEFALTFKDSPAEGETQRTLTVNRTFSSGTAGVIEVPIGVNCQVEQKPTAGYRFTGDYTITAEADGVTSDPTTTTDTPNVVIVAGTDLTVQTMNYANNLTKPFHVTWVDNNSAERPTLTGASFVLEYWREDPDNPDLSGWVAIDASSRDALGISELPQFTTVNAQNGEYAFTGIPSVDKDGNPVKVRVQTAPGIKTGELGGKYTTAPTYADGTTVVEDTLSDDPTGFVFSEVVKFNATILWNDGNDAKKIRPTPDAMGLKLYRKVEGGTYEEVSVPENWITTSGNSWRLHVDELPRYDDQGREYDYAVKETHPEGTRADYKSYYNNVFGNYMDDTEYCHNGGYITKKIDLTTTYEATKQWNDDGTENRGTPTVTLWRYSVSTDAEGKPIDPGVDEMFNTNRASQVVYHYFDHLEETGKDVLQDGTERPIYTPVYKDAVLSYQLSGNSTTETIHFDHTTVRELPDNYELPLYDQNGNMYVYFVRESGNSDNYVVSYATPSSSAGVSAPEGSEENDPMVTAAQGVGDKGTLTNTRREKAAIKVNVDWKNAAKLSDLDEVEKVKMTIKARNSKGVVEELTVYSSVPGSYDVLTGDKKTNATTVGGFNQNVTEQELTFFVNIYDKYGKPYDMQNATITEISVVKKDQAHTEIQIVDDTFKLHEDDSDWYQASSDYTGPAYTKPEDIPVRADGLKEFSYTLTNTLKGKRNYNLVKRWSGEFPDAELAAMGDIWFALHKTSTGSGASDTINYAIPNPNPSANPQSREWILEIPDLEKYDTNGYAYRYKADELGLLIDGTYSHAGWHADHVRTEDTTTVTNYKESTGQKNFTFTKEWKDNGDESAHGTVMVRVYRKDDLQACLSTLGTSGSSVALSDFTCDYSTVTISKHNDWTSQYVTLQKIEEDISGRELTEDNLRYSDYVILEYSVNYGTAQSAVYDYDELLRAVTSEQAIPKVSGHVQNSYRQYDTIIKRENENTENRVLITNTRTGQATLILDKTWKDEGEHPDLIFQLYRNGSELTRPSAPVEDEEAGETPPSLPGPESIIPSGEDGAFTVDFSNQEAWEQYVGANGTVCVHTADGAMNPVVILRDLPLFNEDGVQYIYNVSEGAVDTYSSEKGTTTAQTNVDGKPDNVHYTFKYTNTKVGSTMHVAYKKWNDLAIGGDDRPDLQLTLYQYLLDEAENSTTELNALPSWKQYKEKDPIWTPLSASAAAGSSGSQSTPDEFVAPINETGYDWRIWVDNLPAYNEEGKAYGYVFLEEMSGGNSTSYGTYVQKHERMEATATNPSAPYVDVFTNTLVGTTTFSGGKVWVGLKNFKVGTEDLPDPKMILYRSSKRVTLSDQNVDALIADNTITPVNTTTLNAEKNGYSFPSVKGMTLDQINAEVNAGNLILEETYVSAMTEEQITEAIADGELVRDGDKYFVPKLPKFAPDGSWYYYTVWEELEDGIAKQLYTKLSASGTMTNTFRDDVNRRAIKVEKTWDNRKLLTNPHKVYPTVTYTLYRYTGDLVIPEGSTAITAPGVTEIAKKTIPGQTFANNAADEGAASVTFDDLLIYSPKGELYKYFVVETPVSGYTIEYADEGYDEDNYGDTGVSNYSDVVSCPKDVDGNAIVDSQTNPAKVKTENSYDQAGAIRIQGQKIWHDYGDSEGVRPPSIELNVTRSAGTGSQAVENAPITLVEYTPPEGATTNTLPERTPEQIAADTYYIVWTKEENAWTYTIYDLEKYAPNGKAYTYTICETAVQDSPYEANSSQSTAKAEDATDDTPAVAAPNLENKYTMKHTVRKTWMDSNNRYELRPTTVTVVLERRQKGSTVESDWQTISWDGKYSENDSFEQVQKGGSNVVGMTLSATNVVRNTNGNSWEATFENLPKYGMLNGEMVEWEYRCAELKIGNEYLDNDKKAASYDNTLTVYSPNKTTIYNGLDATVLVVEKKWQQDEDNMYFSRPAKLQFKLQMRGYELVDTKDADGNPLMNENGEPIQELEYKEDGWRDVNVDGKATFTLTAPDWKITLKELPLFIYVSGNQKYYPVQFRAVEVTSQNGHPTGALNYIENTSYEVESQDHIRNEDNVNQSTIRNNLIHHDDSPITVQKVWYKDDTSPAVTAKFELLYRIKDSGEEWRDFYDPITDTEQHVTQTISSTATGAALTFKWENLPKYDRDFKELEYKVVETAINGYATRENVNTQGNSYTFTNIEEQSYTVQKIWQNAPYAQKTEDGFTATFDLEQQIAGQTTWTKVVFPTGSTQNATVPLTTTAANGTEQHTWTNLPKYTDDGKAITYRARETHINGIPVDAQNTNGAYIVSYTYGDADAPAHAGTETVATNRMVYGFVNLQKKAAYLSPNVTDGETKLSGVTFDIYSGTGDSKTLYVSGVTTDVNGNLNCNTDGTYGEGDDARYLIAGTYTLVESQTGAEYSTWGTGVEFTVGTTGGNDNTGEHGTAWVSTTGVDTTALETTVTYQHPAVTHSAICGCKEPATLIGDDAKPAYNLESRGILSFQKTDFSGLHPVDAHNASEGENKAWFGVYLDEDCTELVAYMAADSDPTSDPTKMELTLNAPPSLADYAHINLSDTNLRNGLPYLRQDTSNGPLTLLSGTYYVKELVAPAGYILDTVVRQAEIKKLDSNLSQPYSSNVGKFTSETNKENWPNKENQLKLYKLDQYGRKVQLKSGEYLVLKAEAGNFLTGENEIRLYQNEEEAFKKKNGDSFTDADNEPGIRYDETNECWIITGLLDAGKSYTISEPTDSVPADHTQAVDFTFTMQPDGTITSDHGTQKDNPLEARGDDFVNYYHAANTEKTNQVVLRDPAHFRKNVILEKKNLVTGERIPNIAFGLYTDVTENGETVKKSVLPENIYLVTDANGQINLGNYSIFLRKNGNTFERVEVSTTEYVKNVFTNCDLKYGLDVGTYYFKEIEYGASDVYKLIDPVQFTIESVTLTATDPAPTQEDDYAQVTFDSPATQEVNTDKGTVTNAPVDRTNLLNLSKVDAKITDKKLAGARFTLVYKSINHDQSGAQTGTGEGSDATKTYYGVTDSDGALYETDKDWNYIPNDSTKHLLDISMKGYYTLTEVQAPDYYMTRTENGLVTPIALLTFFVDSDNTIKKVKTVTGSADLIPANPPTTQGTQGTSTTLNVTVNNEKTVVSVAKLNDLVSDTKTRNQKNLDGEPLTGAKLEILEGSTVVWSNNGQTNQSTWDLPEGTLKENTVYELREVNPPVGFRNATSIYFKLFGVTTVDSKHISQLYVYTGTGAPASATGTNWDKTTNINTATGKLTMVDEAIIAPVDLLKLVGEDAQTGTALKDAEFLVTSLDGNMELGTAITKADGHLVWKSVKTGAYAKELIYDSTGKRITSSDEARMAGQTIILRQNEHGYSFRETFAPAHAYNDGGTYTVKITEANYIACCTDSGYDTSKYVDIITANSKTNNEAATTDPITPLVNPPYHSTVQLHKYDADREAAKAIIPGTEFTLYHVEKDENGEDKPVEVTQGVANPAESSDTTQVTDSYCKFLTGTSGDLKITINRKGTYILKETKAAEGYDKTSTEFAAASFRFTLVDRRTATDDLETVFAYNGVNTLQKDTNGVPNTRLMGSVTLTKQDKDATGADMCGVEFILRRTTTPKDAEGNALTTFDECTVVVGKHYKAVLDNNTWTWTLECQNLGDEHDLSNHNQIIIDGLDWTSYSLTESKEKNGYVFENPKTYAFTVSAGQRNPQVNADAQNNVVPNNKNQLTFIKRSTEDSPATLSGAQFELYRVYEDTSITPAKLSIPKNTEGKYTAQNFYPTLSALDATASVIEVGDSGSTDIFGLPAGSYVLRETLAPQGYELAQDVFFTMQQNGKVTAVTTCTVDADSVVHTDADGGIVASVVTPIGSTSSKLTVKDKPIEVNLKKSVSSGTLTAIRGEAEYDITGIFVGQSTSMTRHFTGNEIQENSTDSQKNLKAIFIGGYSYTLKETKAPLGYETRPEVIITVGTDGKVTADDCTFLVCNNEIPNAASPDGVAYLTLTDDPIAIKLDKKHNLTDTTSLTDAVFTISGKMISADGQSVEDDGEITDVTVANAQDKTRGRLISDPNITYTVTETTPPKGYILTDPFTIKINRDGTITAVNSDKAEVDSTDAEMLVVADDPTVVKIAKVEDENKPLPNAKFELTPVNPTGNFVNLPAGNANFTATKISWTSANEPQDLTSYLVAGERYRLHEVARVPNHEIMTKFENGVPKYNADGTPVIDDVIFYVTPQGVVEIVEPIPQIPNHSDVTSASADNSTKVITIQNPIIRGSVTLIKYWKDRPSITNADAIDAANLLGGATYTLTRVKDEKDETVNETVKTNSSFAYDVNGSESKFITDDQGEISITGLPEGTYEFEEIAAPMAYHINKGEKLTFEIHEASKATAVWAHDANDGNAIDTRINAKITINKLTDDGYVSNFKFDVRYSETENGEFKHIGYIENGATTLSQGDYSQVDGSTSPEGLRRGYYQLEELSADNQMLNTQNNNDPEHGLRNIITFQIGNEIGKDYKLNTALDTYIKGYDSDGIQISNTDFIFLTDDGVMDTPIPRKQISLQKYWPDDTDMTATFRPASVTVKLYRTANGETTEVPNSEKTLNSNNNWSCSWDNLPAYVNLGAETETTYLYTYKVKETRPAWYTDNSGLDATYTITPGLAGETGVKDGNTTVALTNSLTGGPDSQYLTISKVLGGGSDQDTFYVRVIVKKGETVIGNNSYGYYLDPCGVFDSEGNPIMIAVDQPKTVTPDNTDGWMEIHGGETIKVKLPAGVDYEIEEKTASNGDAEITSASGNTYTYIPRYDAAKIGSIEKDKAAPSTTVLNAVHKYIHITKLGANNATLTGAVFSVQYVPGTTDTNNSNAVGPAWTKYNLTLDSDGYLCNGTTRLDITQRGDYIIRETRAPADYITPTDNDGNPIVLATVSVSAEDIMTVTRGDGNAAALVTLDHKPADGVLNGVAKDGSVASLTIKNEQTRAKIGKTIDYAAHSGNMDDQEGNPLVGASLKLSAYNENTGEWVDVAEESWTTETTAYTTALGVLQENVRYKLEEVASTVPVGYKKSAPVYFCLNGTYTESSERYSRIVLQDEHGNVLTDQNTNGDVYGAAGVIGAQLNMVDETIIAPVSLQKVLKKSETDYTALTDGVVVFEVKAGENVLGEAYTDAEGYLVWRFISNYNTGLIYDVNGKLLTSYGADTKIILRQNADGYTFQEIDAPSDVYNDGRTYTVKVTEGNYDEYRTAPDDGKLYNSSKYINIVDADDTTHEVTSLTVRPNPATTTHSTRDHLAVNLPYHSTVTLHKYDADEEAVQKPLAGTQFTLYKDSVADDNIYKKAYLTDGTVNITGIFETDNNGDLSIEIPEKGTYILKETTPTVGYTGSTEFTFELLDIADAAQIAEKKFGYNQENALKWDDNGVPNTRKMGTVTLVKQDGGTNEELSKVIYTLTRNSIYPSGNVADTFLLHSPVNVKTGHKYEARKVSGTWILVEENGTPGKLEITGLNWGEYTLQEYQELSGYVYDGAEYTFKVGPETPYSLLNELGTVTNAKNEVTFYKTNTEETGVTLKGLEGAEFVVHKGNTCNDDCELAQFYETKNTTTTTNKVISGPDGKVSIYGLQTYTTNSNGSITLTPDYHLVETKAPKGYKLQPTPVYFTIDRDGIVKVNSSTVDQVTMTDEPIKIYLDKVGEQVEDKLVSTFKLTDVCTETCDHKFADGQTAEMSLTTAEDTGEIMIPLETVIAEHTYKLEETASAPGYKCNVKLTFDVKTDGTVELQPHSGGAQTLPAAELDSTKTHIQISNEKIRLQLVKEDFENPAVKLEGVKFELKPVGESKFSDNSTEAKTETTDANGLIEFGDALLVCGGTYELTEIDNPDHSYRFANEKEERQITIKVKDKGEISVVNVDQLAMFALDEVKSDDDYHMIPVIHAKNQKISLEILKVDAVNTDNALAGIEFKLTKVSDGTTVAPTNVTPTADGTWLTPSDGKVIFKAIDSPSKIPFTDGTYQLAEIATQPGYNLLPEPLEFTIDRTGKISYDAGDYDVMYVKDNPTDDSKPGGIQLTMKNPAYTTMALTKTDPQGNPITQPVKFRMEYKHESGYSSVKLESNVLQVDTDGVPVVGTAVEAEITTVNGSVNIINLPDGIYKLTEIQTAPGYNLLSQPLFITISRTTGKCTWRSGETGTPTDLDMSTTDGDVLPICVINQKGFVFPATGTTTPELPKWILGITAFLEGLALYLYHRSTKRRRKGAAA